MAHQRREKAGRYRVAGHPRGGRIIPAGRRGLGNRRILPPRGSHRPKLNAAVRLHHFGTRTFDIGRLTLDVGARRPLGLYSAERSLVDAVRLRHDEGADLAWEALGRWLQRPGSSPSKLLELAKRLKGAEGPLRTALEVLQ